MTPAGPEQQYPLRTAAGPGESKDLQPGPAIARRVSTRQEGSTMTRPATVTSPVSEADWQKRITDLCDLLGLTWTHFRAAIDRSGRWTTPLSGRKGWPDLVIAGPGGVIFVELKSDTGKIGHDQQHWLDMLHDGGCECHVWRPRHWAAVERRLRLLARPTVLDVSPSR